ncbi:MAG TPA: NAD-dependent epimerase/dehydratase family protein [Steroidobacteraceae bacterium]
MTSRRQLLHWGACLAASGVLPRALAAERRPKTLLILGGTGFIGPHLTKQALRLGWKVTHFNRGKHAPDGVADVETLIGDRNGQIDALRARKWDVVIDDTGQIPKYVKMSADLLAPNVGYCLFISSISAYASFAKPNDETSPLGQLSDPNVDKTTDETYGPMKALCEHYSMQAFEGRASVVRPGYIVGPLDGTDRFTYWPVRASKGGEMMAPGTPSDPIQIIDVRDLAVWMMKLAQERTTGYFNAISPPRAFTMGDIIEASLRASPQSGTKATWIPEDFLARQWKVEELDFPPWSPMSGETAGASLTSTMRAQKAGLKVRPMKETVADTLAWFHTLPPERQAKLRAGIDPQKEADVLEAWHAKADKRPS